MSREIDSRVVAMYFDNKNFEKNAQTTIKTLEELKKGMDLEKATKGFESLKKASENLKLDDMERKVKNLQHSFSGLRDVASKAFDIGTAPMRSMENLFHTFQSYVTKFIGFDLAGKLVGGIENAVRQLTVAPVSAGWHEYELKMDSIKTIMSGSGESLDVVKEKLEELNHYADQTVYSFSDMTSNIGKFTNNKVKLDDATAAMKGIANATADAGQGAQQASMAMYNISQAFGVGSMKMIDWKSLENANIATVRLKDTFIQAGVAQGKLTRKVEKDKKTGVETIKYYVKGFEKGTKAVEVTAENFRETLNKDWLDKNTMLNAFKIYSGELKNIADLRRLGFSEALGFTDEDLQKLLGIGEGAMKAATEVRTFTKMYDALKEAAQSGWAESLEFIFGDMEEGTSLWTTLNDKISEMLSKSAEERNSALAEWRGMYKDRNGNWQETADMFYTDPHSSAYSEEWLALEKEKNELEKQVEEQRKNLQNQRTWAKQARTEEEKATAKDAIAAAERELAEKEKKLEEIREQLISGKIPAKAAEATTQIMEKQADGREVLINSFMDLIDVLQTLGGTVSDAWGSVFGKLDAKKLWAITNGFKSFVDRLKTWLGTADKADSRINKISRGFRGLFGVLKVVVNIIQKGVELTGKAVRPIADLAVDLFGKFGTFFDGIGNMNIGEAMTRIGSGFTELWNRLSHISWDDVSLKISEAWGSIKETVKQWMYDNGLGGVWETLRGWKDTLVAGFESIKIDVGAAWDSVKAWFEDSGVAGFFRDAWGWLKDNFSGEEAIRDEEGNIIGSIRTEYDGQATLIDNMLDFLRGIPGQVESAWNTVTGWSGWESIGQFFADTIGWVSAFFQPKKRYDDRGFELNDTRSPVEKFLSDAWDSIKMVWNDIVSWPLWGNIGQFLGDTWGWITRFFRSQKRYDDRGFELNDQRSPAAKFLDDAWESIKSVWDRIVHWEGWGAIGSFFTDTFGWVTNLISGSANASAGSESGPAEVVIAMAGSVNEAASEVAPTEESVGLLERVLTALGDFWTKIQDFAVKVAQTTGADKVFANVIKVLEILDRIASFIIELVHGAVVEGKLENWGVIIVGAITALVTNIASSRIRLKLAGAVGDAEGIGSTILKIGAAIVLIAAAMAVISKIDSADLGKAVGTVVIIGVVIGALSTILAKNRKSELQQDKVTALERFGETAVKWIGIVGAVWVAMEELPGIISAMKESGLTGSDVLSTITSIVLLVAGLGTTATLLGKMSGGSAASIKATAIGALNALIGVSILLTGMVTLFAAGGALANLISDEATITGNIERAGRLLSAIGSTIGAFFVSFATGANAKINGAYNDQERKNLEWAAEMAEEFTPERLTALVRFAETVGTINGQVPDDMSGITYFANKLPGIGTALADFMTNFKAVFTGSDAMTLDEVQQNITTLQGLSQMMTDLVVFFELFDRAYDTTFSNYFSEGAGDKFKRTSFWQAVTSLIEDAQKGLGEVGELSFDATPVVDSIVVALGYGETAIATAVHAMVQAGINKSENGGTGTGGYDLSNLLNFGSNGENPLGWLTGENSPLGESGGLTGMVDGFLEGFNSNEMIQNLDTVAGDFFTNLQDKFTITDLQTQLGDFFPKDEGEMDSMLQGWQDKLGTIGEQLEMDGVQVVITPVFDMSDLEAGIAQINQYFAQNPIMGDLSEGIPQIAINIENDTTIRAIETVRDRVIELIERVSAENSANIEAIMSMRGEIDSVARSVASMRVYLDTGVLAGAIDDELGIRMLLAGRTG